MSCGRTQIHPNLLWHVCRTPGEAIVTKCLFCGKRTTRKLVLTSRTLSNTVDPPHCCKACNADLDLIAAADARDSFNVTTNQLGKIPHVLCWEPGGGGGQFNLGRKYKSYRRQDVEALAEEYAEHNARRNKPCDLLLALFTLNRRAKRCRDLAPTYYKNGQHGFAGYYRREKETIYAMKGQALHYLVAEGRLTHAGYHQFARSGLTAELLAGEGFRFHRPCEPVDGLEPSTLDEIESIPKCRKEPTLRVARRVVAEYLADKPHVPVYQCPRRARDHEPCVGFDNEWDDDDEWDDDM